MKKKDLILISIIIILVITLIGVIIYYNKYKFNTITTEAKILAIGSDYLLITTNNNEDYIIDKKDLSKYQVGDKIEIELTNIDKTTSPNKAKSNNIKIIEKSTNINNSDDSIENNKETENNNIKNEQVQNKVNNNNQSNNQSNNQANHQMQYTEQEIITYFETLNNELTTYDNNQNLGEKIKSKFVTCIDFIFYEKEIGGKTFNELTNSTKLKILEICLAIDSKIETKFPGYKENINSKYQNIKTKIIEKYLDTTTTICNNNENLCNDAKKSFSSLKSNFNLTWDIIKNLAGTSITKLKDWYEIWRYN